MSTLNTFDPKSGQVYTETIIRASRREPSKWFTHCIGSKPKRHSTPRPETGTRSLELTAIRSVLCNLEALDTDTLKQYHSANPQLVEKIWDAVKRE